MSESSFTNDPDPDDFSLYFDPLPEKWRTKSLSKECRAANVETLEQSAASGDPAAQYRVAAYYLKHELSFYEDLTENHRQAFRWGKLAADQGHRRAQALVGYCYSTGTGIPQNGELALDFYRRSALQGYSIAETALGIFFLTGKHVQPDLWQALHWFVRGARHGCPESMMKLAEIYNDGRIGTIRLDRAFRWWLRAARCGLTAGKLEVARAYFHAIGTERDYDLFLFWIHSAAADNNGEADSLVEHANTYIRVDSSFLRDKGLPINLGTVHFRRRTVIKMHESRFPPVREMIEDVQHRWPHTTKDEIKRQEGLVSRLNTLWDNSEKSCKSLH